MALGMSLTLNDTIEKFMGRSFQYCKSEINSQLGRTVEPEFWQIMQEETYEAFELELLPVPGIKEVLDILELDYCVASSGSHEKMQKTLRLTGLLPYFTNRMFSATEVRRGKPAPDLFIHAAKQMQCSPAGCLVIEDSPYGAEAAIAAGMRVLGYTGSTPEQRLREKGAEVFSDMRELPILLGNINEN